MKILHRMSIVTLTCILTPNFADAADAKTATSACEPKPLPTSGAKTLDDREVQRASGAGLENSAENVDATLWFQTSAEYRAAAKTVYAAATKRLTEILSKPHHGKLAIVVDVDETVLDNSQYQAELVLTGTSYDTDYKWNDWVAAEKAAAVPGAVAFLNAAGRNHVRVFYITNRKCDDTESCPQKVQTWCNLTSKSVGIKKVALDDLMLKNERADWPNDEKAPRRAAVEAMHYKIVLMLGDQLSDFVQNSVGRNPAERAALEEKNQAHWGKDWFALPNPMYGDYSDGRFISGTKAALLKGYP